MKLVAIHADEFIPLSDKTDFQITSKVMYQLFRFYKKHAQDALYVVESDDRMLNSYFDIDNLDIYAAYGVVVSDGAVMMNPKRSYLLILSAQDLETKDTLASAVRKRREECGCTSFSSCAVECDFENAGEQRLHEMALRLHEALGDSCSVLNYPLRVNKSRRSRANTHLPQYRYVDVNGLVDAKVSAFDDAAAKAKNLYHLYNKIVRYPDPEDNVVFCLEKEDKCSLFGYAISAALATLSAGKRFHYGSETEFNFMASYMRSLFRKENMYLEDYVGMVKNFPDLSVIVNSNAFLLVKDYSRMEPKDCMFTSVQMKIDLDTMKLQDRVYESVNYSFSEIKELSLRKRFGLDSRDFGTAAEGLKRLTGLLNEMDRYVSMDSGLLAGTALNISNMLLYEFDGVAYLGFVPYVSTELPFVVYPAADGFTSFRTRLNLQDVIPLDIRIFYDWKQITAKMVAKGLVRLENSVYRLAPYSRGMLLNAVNGSVMFPEDLGLYTFEELGVWGTQSRMTRTSLKELEYLRKDYLQQIGFLTAYGGPHPCEGNTFVIRSDAWR